jgi:hypothetical protein
MAASSLFLRRRCCLLCSVDTRRFFARPESPSEKSHLELLSFRSTSLIDTSWMKARSLRLGFSKSLVSRRQRLSQANVRSTTAAPGSRRRRRASPDRAKARTCWPGPRSRLRYLGYRPHASEVQDNDQDIPLLTRNFLARIIAAGVDAGRFFPRSYALAADHASGRAGFSARLLMIFLVGACWTFLNVPS